MVMVSDKPQDVARDYILELDRAAGEAPLLTVYGGKITTYRRMAEARLRQACPDVRQPPRMDAGRGFRGAIFESTDIDRLMPGCASWPFLSEATRGGWCAPTGRGSPDPGGSRSLNDLGPNLGADLTAAEVRYLMAQEWAQTEDDVLWRRSKLGLRVSRDERARLARS